MWRVKCAGSCTDAGEQALNSRAGSAFWLNILSTSSVPADHEADSVVLVVSYKLED